MTAAARRIVTAAARVVEAAGGAFVLRSPPVAVAFRGEILGDAPDAAVKNDVENKAPAAGLGQARVGAQPRGLAVFQAVEKGLPDARAAREPALA